ncbi:MAG: S41 family peptidase [Candidatus Delongbacteria bacterium]|nr:S41 family peptidase [Candidatus Delongbacteria bacterium]MBN2835554.1 S41 family peptidase [Candidatus Delongbacteria bacterium]
MKFIYAVLLMIIAVLPLTKFKAYGVEMEKCKQLVDSLSDRLNKTYVFPDKALEMEKILKKNLKKYNKIESDHELAQELTKDMRSVYNDGHLEIFVMPPRPEGSMVRSNEDMEKEMSMLAKSKNYQFQKVEILDGNLGYLRLNGFEDVTYAGETAVSAMNFLANTDGLIIDLRENGGGSPSMIQLISSYFFDDVVHLNSFYIRETGETEQYWTQKHVQGKKYLDKPIYILTSHYTYSAAEEFSYNLKNLKRATIVGEITGGGAHPVNMYPMPELGFMLKIPFGRAVNPITNDNWEQVGVKPDIESTKESALDVAISTLYQSMIDNPTEGVNKEALQWALDGLNFKNNPYKIENNDDISEFCGVFGPRKIQLEDGKLIYSRGNNPAVAMIPFKKDWFIIEGVAFFRMEFRRNSDGKIDAIIGHYDNGRMDLTEKK